MIPLFEHQRRVVAAAMLQPRLWINACYGSGKTVCALEIIKQKKARCLVIAPLTLIETSWRGDWERFGYGYQFCNLRDHEKVLMPNSGPRGFIDPARLQQPSLCIINPEMFIRISSEMPDGMFDMLIIDEASRLKNRTSKIAKAVYEMSKRVKSVYLLSGNLAPNSEDEYFSPIRCLDEELFGKSYYGFMNSYFTASVGYAPGQRQFKKWAIKPQKKQDLADKLKRVSIRVGKEDAPELPPQTFVTRSIELEPEQRRVYETLKKEWIVKWKETDILAANALSELSKLRQIASGFVYDSGNALVLGDGKLKGLLSTLEEIGPQQVVIFSVWQEEIRQIKEALGEKAGCVYGEASEGEKTEAIKAFQEGRLQYLVCHPRSGGVGLNLQAASYAVYASLDYSLESFEQSVARIHRAGQANPCTYTFLLAKDTIDEKIMKCIMQKQDVSLALQELMKEPSACLTESQRNG